MDVRCMHFCDEYRKHATGTYDLIGIFNTLSTDSFPWRHMFWLYVLFDVDDADRRFRHPVAVRTTGPSGKPMTWQEHLQIRHGRGVHRPHVWWVTQIHAEFDQPGYYHYEVLWDGAEIGGDKILVRRR